MKKYCKEEISLIENIPGIYLIKNTINEKCYIGQSIYLKKRLLKHITLSDRKMYDTPLYKAIQKYGIEVFEFDILETLNTSDYKLAKTQLDIWEKEYIKKYNSYGDSGYNQTVGGDPGILGYKFTEDQKQHQSDARKNFESNKIDLIYLYLIEGTNDCKYITAGNITILNNILSSKGLKTIDPRYLRDAKNYISIYDLYIIATSKDELEIKISKFKKATHKDLEEYKQIIESLEHKTLRSIMNVTGLDKNTVYNRNLQVFGQRVLERMRK